MKITRMVFAHFCCVIHWNYRYKLYQRPPFVRKHFQEIYCNNLRHTFFLASLWMVVWVLDVDEKQWQQCLSLEELDLILDNDC